MGQLICHLTFSNLSKIRNEIFGLARTNWNNRNKLAKQLLAKILMQYNVVQRNTKPVRCGHHTVVPLTESLTQIYLFIGIVHKFFSFVKSLILGYDGVWYSSFWSEGSQWRRESKPLVALRVQTPGDKI